MGSDEIGGLLELLKPLGELGKELAALKEILLGVVQGQNGQLSSEGSLAGSSGAGDIAGSALGSAMGSAGIDEDLVNQIPTNEWGIIGSVGKYM
ncbi:hypothetical protein [Corynebacterium nuruki]|jgi:hypothetical protein|uniref:hypothetical protein n=1 Tax=Corynebacterium nuruki TaxID=1032851 RepID=UPI0002486F65|nr:hypothetical protein [Corynebacterium nuruki]